MGEVKGRKGRTLRGRKQRPSFSKTVTHSDWERISQELKMSCTGSKLDHTADNQPRACQGLVFPFCGERMVTGELGHLPHRPDTHFNGSGTYLLKCLRTLALVRQTHMGDSRWQVGAVCHFSGFPWSQTNTLPRRAFLKLRQLARSLYMYPVKQNALSFTFQLACPRLFSLPYPVLSPLPAIQYLEGLLSLKETTQSANSLQGGGYSI